MDLGSLGWAELHQTAFETRTESSWVPARVISAQREHLRVAGEFGSRPAVVSGKLRHTAAAGGLPVVGDWVLAALGAGEGLATVHALLPRRSVLARKRPDRTSEPQLMAANVDFVFAVTALNQDFSPRRIERALALIWEGGSQPVVLLTKLDGCDDPQPYLGAIAGVALGVPVHAISVHAGIGLEALDGYFVPGRTVALIGSSGVGKSTLLNYALGEERAETREARADDDKGRHTTTARELHALPRGGLVIDTPGMRELGLWDAACGLETAFEDVEVLAGRCRFGDCQHAGEPGCAVREAVSSGELESSRLASYEKLQRELAHERRRHDERARLDHQREVRRIFRQRARAQRSHPKR